MVALMLGLALMFGVAARGGLWTMASLVNATLGFGMGLGALALVMPGVPDGGGAFRRLLSTGLQGRRLGLVVAAYSSVVSIVACGLGLTLVLLAERWIPFMDSFPPTGPPWAGMGARTLAAMAVLLSSGCIVGTECVIFFAPSRTWRGEVARTFLMLMPLPLLHVISRLDDAPALALPVALVLPALWLSTAARSERLVRRL